MIKKRKARIHDEILGVILAGGKSSRFGENKAFLKVNGGFLIEKLVLSLSGIFEKVIIVADSINKFSNLRFGDKKIDIIKDAIPDKGPLGGIYTALLYSDFPFVFVTACDMPFLTEKVIRDIICDIDDYDIVIPKVKKRVHPLCAVYSKGCIEVIKGNLEKGDLKVKFVFNKLKTKFINMEKDIVAFFNINTKKDYEKISR